MSSACAFTKAFCEVSAIENYLNSFKPERLLVNVVHLKAVASIAISELDLNVGSLQNENALEHNEEACVGAGVSFDLRVF